MKAERRSAKRNCTFKSLFYERDRERGVPKEMALMAVLESDLRALSAEARRRYPAVKDAAEHAILKVLSSYSFSTAN